MKIAIVEDDINMRKSLEIALKDHEDFELKTFKNAIEALKKLDNTYDVVVTDINMPKMDGMEFIKNIDFPIDVIIMTGNATLNRTIESIRLANVKDFLTKPFEIETLIESIKRCTKVTKIQSSLVDRMFYGKDRRVGSPDNRKYKIERRKQGRDKRKKFYGSSTGLEKTLNILNKASKTDATIMLLGESGVGKELFSRHIHENSPRHMHNFIAINMAAIPENLLESELFGYEKGAFTDATTPKKGLFEVAHKGTLFLDEIGEMPLSLQAKILRVLQEREIVRVGGTKPIKIDVRIISATNANIMEKIDDKLFREDLYYRLNTIPVNIPPLRERREEIIDTAVEALNQASIRYNLSSKEFSDESIDAMMKYNWPGNFRELLSVVERAVILSEGNVITENDLFLESRKRKKSIQEMEKELICEMLIDTNHNMSETATLLGMSKRNLEKKIKTYEIEVIEDEKV